MKQSVKNALLDGLITILILTVVVRSKYCSRAGLSRDTIARLMSLAMLPIVLLGILQHPKITVAAGQVILFPSADQIFKTDKPISDGFGQASVEDPALPLKSKPALKTFKAVKTQYSRADSCHNIKNGHCLMASGRAVYAGAVACPKFLPLGTTIRLDDKIYTCEDRYSERLDGLRGLPTIDVFVESNPRGREIEQIEVVSWPKNHVAVAS